VGDLSAHFDSREFVDRRTGDRPIPSSALVALLERIRAHAGAPVAVVSGYRCLKTNAAVGGAPNSRHTYGDAADIRPGLVRPDDAVRLGATGVGERGGWAVHVDVRPGPLARWTYP
jgi:zinc D-Ala-D-Ala carboxypeptidase